VVVVVVVVVVVDVTDLGQGTGAGETEVGEETGLETGIAAVVEIAGALVASCKGPDPQASEELMLAVVVKWWVISRSR